MAKHEQHVRGVSPRSAVASGTRLVFAAGASTEVNYGLLRTFAAANGDLLLSKSIGLPTHSGGAPFVNANSQQYKDLAALLPKLKESCSSEVIATGEFWASIKFADDATVLQKAANLFQGRNPSAMEKAAVAGGGETVLRQTIRGYMDNGPVFDAFLQEGGQFQFLSAGVVPFGNNRGLVRSRLPGVGYGSHQQPERASGRSGACWLRHPDGAGQHHEVRCQKRPVLEGHRHSQVHRAEQHHGDDPWRAGSRHLHEPGGR